MGHHRIALFPCIHGCIWHGKARNTWLIRQSPITHIHQKVNTTEIYIFLPRHLRKSAINARDAHCSLVESAHKSYFGITQNVVVWVFVVAPHLENARSTDPSQTNTKKKRWSRQVVHSPRLDLLWARDSRRRCTRLFQQTSLLYIYWRKHRRWQCVATISCGSVS